LPRDADRLVAQRGLRPHLLLIFFSPLHLFLISFVSSGERAFRLAHTG
jgi:hypothetical protein